MRDESRRYFEECMHCRYAMKKMNINTKQWFVLCGRDGLGLSGLNWNDGTRIEVPPDNMRDECPLFVERMMAGLQEED